MRTDAADLVFPLPATVRKQSGTFRLPARWRLCGAPIPVWLEQRLAAACRRTGGRLSRNAGAELRLDMTAPPPVRAADPACAAQGYRLDVAAAGAVRVSAATADGLRHGVITLAQLLDARAAGAHLGPLEIADTPAFRVRGIQIDMAREFFPPLPYLRRIVDRLVDLKANTLWLYLENHFRAPGMEDISPENGMTPAEARAISAYAAARGIDVVPGTNVLSHMEGWLRLERYADLADGNARSYPVLTRPEVWPLVRHYLDALMATFPSPNIHVGLDELLFTGTNPEAAQAIEKAGGKARYYAAFAGKVARHVLAKGKTPWIWDDMVMGKNVYRKEGFGDAYTQALAALPSETVMTHWYYWTDSDGLHSPIIQRVAASGRPFVVAPSARGFCNDDCGSWAEATENQCYMAGCGETHGAFGFVNTHWESQCGSLFEACWPLVASGAGFAWSGSRDFGGRWARAFSFAVCGDTANTLVDYLQALNRVSTDLEQFGLNRAGFRGRLFQQGPHQLWRKLSPVLDRRAQARLDAGLTAAARLHRQLGSRDTGLNRALGWPLLLLREGLALTAVLDRSWARYHAAALAEARPDAGPARDRARADAVAGMRDAAACLRRLATALRPLELTGHSPYDRQVLAGHARELEAAARLMRQAARTRIGLPYFEKLLHLRDCYHQSSLAQFRVQSTFHPWARDKELLPLKRRPLRG